MPTPYSEDFRLQVMEAIELNSLKKGEASQLFNISRHTIDLWFRCKAQTGDVKPKQRLVSQSPSKIDHWDLFRAFVKRYGDKTQAQMAELWQGR